MSDVIDRPALEKEATAATRLRIVDCDIHPSLHSRADLNHFLPKRWQEHMKTYGDHLRTPYIGTTPYPRSSPLICRRDAWPPTGGPPGSDLAFMRKQHLDPLDVEFGILQVLDLFIFSQQNLEFGAAIQRAINEWQLAFWSHRDPRLKASILVSQDDTETALAEIDRCAKTGEYIQVNISPRANEPLGRRRYWPIYQRAEALGLPLGIHVGGYGGHAPTGGGWPSYYCEEHQSNAHTVADGPAFRTLPQRSAASQAQAFGICEGAILVHDAADRRARRGQASAATDRMGRYRPAVVLVGLSALGFRRPALCLQDAAHGRRAEEDLQHQRARGLQDLMARHVVARTSEIPPGGNKVVGIDGRDIVVFHVNGEFFALLNRCPHEGAPLDKAACVARLTSPEPGVYQRSRVGELLRCAWHGWEFDMRNGQSWFDPKRFKVRSFPVAVESGEELAAEMKKGPYVAETLPVVVEDSYVIVET